MERIDTERWVQNDLDIPWSLAGFHDAKNGEKHCSRFDQLEIHEDLLCGYMQFMEFVFTIRGIYKIEKMVKSTKKMILVAILDSSICTFRMCGNEQVFAFLVDKECSEAELANINHIRTSLSKLQCGHTGLPWFLYEVENNRISEVAKCKYLRHGIIDAGVKSKTLAVVNSE